MAIEVGDLYLAITAPGGTQAEGALKKVDKAAQSVAVSANNAQQRIAAANVVTSKLGVAMQQVDARTARAAQSTRALAAAQEKVAAAVEAERLAYRALNAAGRGILPTSASDMAKLDRAFEQSFAKRALAEKQLAALQVREQTKALALVNKEARASAIEQRRLLVGGLGASGFRTGGGFLPVIALTASIGALKAISDAGDAARAAQNRLRGAAIDTGRAFADVVREADAVRKRYLLTRDDAATLTLALSKLEQVSKRAGVSQGVLDAAMVTLKARGITGADAVKEITDAINGNDEAIRQLTGLKPDQLYDAYAKAAGRAGDKLSDVGKANALVNGILAESARRLNDASTATDTLKDKQDKAAQSWDDMLVAMSKSITPLKSFLADVATGAANTLNRLMELSDSTGVDSWLARMDAQANAALTRVLPKFQAFFDRLSGRKPSPLAGQFIGPKVPAGFVAPAVVAPHKPNADDFAKSTKDAKDETDALIASIATLREGERLRAEDMQRAQSIYLAEQKILEASTTSLERRAKALERLQALERGGAVIGAQPMQQLRDPGLSQTVVTPDLLPKVELPSEDSFTTTADEYWQNFYAAFIGREPTARQRLQDYYKQAAREIGDQLVLTTQTEVTAAFGTFTIDIASSVIDSIAAGFEKGGKGMKEALLGSLGAILKHMGKSLILSGLALKGLLPALSNPFTSGFAMVAAGTIITAAGATLSRIAGGPGGDSGGTVGGGSGSLGTNAPNTAPQIYTFGQRPAASPGNPASAQQPVTVNFTVIGERDPVAQRQLASMVRAAVRNGHSIGAEGHS